METGQIPQVNTKHPRFFRKNSGSFIRFDISHGYQGSDT